MAHMADTYTFEDGRIVPLLDWSTLDADQVATLVTSSDMHVGLRLFTTTFGLLTIGEITDRVKQGDGDVHWSGDATVHRDCTFTTAVQLNPESLVRVVYVLADGETALAAQRDVGVFVLATPETQRGETVLVNGAETQAWSYTGQDRLYFLDRQVGKSYSLASGTNVLTAIVNTYTAAGLSGFQIDTAASAKTLPTAMTWPLIPGTVADPGTSDDTSTPATWLTIINDLHKLINYRPVWCDETGQYRSGPLVQPEDQSTLFTFDATDERTNVGAQRSVSFDQWHTPNRWIFTQSNLGSGVPPVAGAGLYVVDNLTDGPSSQNARGLVWPTQVELTAADQTSLVAQGDAQVKSDKRSTRTYSLTTAPFPLAGHYDVYGYVETDRSARVQPSDWRLPFDGSDMTWAMTEILGS